MIVVDDRAVLAEIARLNANARMAAHAPLGILICGDLSLEKSPGFWVVDCAAAMENLLLAAHASGLGGVWIGVYPRQERMDILRRLFGLPEQVIAPQPGHFGLSGGAGPPRPSVSARIEYTATAGEAPDGGRRIAPVSIGSRGPGRPVRGWNPPADGQPNANPMVEFLRGATVFAEGRPSRAAVPTWRENP